MNALTNRRHSLATLAILSLLLLWTGLSQATSDSGYLGVMLQEINPSMAKALQMGERTGVLVVEVVDESPADEAGLRDGDVILEFAGQDIDGVSALTETVRATEPDTKVKLLILRDGKQEKIKIRVGTTTTDDHMSMTFDFPGLQKWQDEDADNIDLAEIMPLVHEDHGFLGVSLEDLTEQLGTYFKVEKGEGALVSGVQEDSPAASSGLQAGDVIVKIDGTEVTSASSLIKSMQKTEPQDKVTLKVIRKGKKKTFQITLGEMPTSSGHHAMGKRFFRDDDQAFFHRRMKGSPQVRILRKEREDGELDQLHEELDQLREELNQLREDLEKTK